jgi:hypothetical protein
LASFAAVGLVWYMLPLCILIFVVCPTVSTISRTPSKPLLSIDPLLYAIRSATLHTHGCTHYTSDPTSPLREAADGKGAQIGQEAQGRGRGREARELADHVLEGVLGQASALQLLVVVVERGLQAVVARLELEERGAGLP